MVHDTLYIDLLFDLLFGDWLTRRYVGPNPRGGLNKLKQLVLNVIPTCYSYDDIVLSPNDRLGKRRVKCAMLKMNDIQDLRSISVSLCFSSH